MYASLINQPCIVLHGSDYPLKLVHAVTILGRRLNWILDGVKVATMPGERRSKRQTNYPKRGSNLVKHEVRERHHARREAKLSMTPIDCWAKHLHFDLILKHSA